MPANRIDHTLTIDHADIRLYWGKYGEKFDSMTQN